MDVLCCAFMCLLKEDMKTCQYSGLAKLPATQLCTHVFLMNDVSKIPIVLLQPTPYFLGFFSHSCGPVKGTSILMAILS